MSIAYDSSLRTFHLRGKTFSYCLSVAEDGTLMNLHWGEKIHWDDLRYVLAGFHEGASFDKAVNRQPLECPTRGTGYYGTPAVTARGAQGDDAAVLAYAGHQIVTGKAALEGLPAVYIEQGDDAETLTIELADALTGLRVFLSYTVLEDFDVLTRSMKLTNGGSAPLEMSHMASASQVLPGTNFDIMHLKGGWARERQVVRSPLGQAKQAIESQRGASGHEENPFLALMERSATEDSGRVWATTLVYSGSFAASAETTNFGTTRLTIGLNPEVCRWHLEPGESFQTPEAILVFSTEGLGGMSDRFHQVIRKRIVRGAWRDKDRPILINNWEATYFNFDEDKIMDIARRASQIGVELFVLDDGWFGRRDKDNCSLGDWVVDKRKLPGGLGGLCEKLNAVGLDFGLWFEPEMISPDSDLYRAHPDWCLHIDGRPRTESRQQLILDLSRSEVQDYLIEAVSSVLRSANIRYVKWDMNRNMTEYASAGRAPERQLETQHRYMLGLYRVLEEITSAFPDVLFESCSGGGGRFDAGMLYYMPQTWTSDDTDPMERLGIQYGTSMVYPAAAMGAHVSASPNHQTGRSTSIQTRGDVAIGGNFGFELDLSSLSDEDIEGARRLVETVKQVRSIVQKGRFLRIESPFEGNWTSWQFISEDQNEALLCVYRRQSEPNPVLHRVYAKGLDEKAIYQVEGFECPLSGSALMYVGLPVRMPRGDYSSLVLPIKKLV